MTEEPANAPPEPTWLESLRKSLKTQIATWIVAIVIGILGLFSGRITESIKFALNKADLRTKQFEELATETSKFIFNSELLAEFIGENWTTKQTLTALVTQYNESVTKLRENEFKYAAWIKKYWGNAEAEKFEEFMSSVRAFDGEIHRLNDEFEKVNLTSEASRVDETRAKEAFKKLEPITNKLRTSGKDLVKWLS